MYFYEKLDKNHEVRGIYQDIVDCVYIITMKMKFIYRYLYILAISFFLYSCSGMPDARKVPVNADERVKKNIEEGKEKTVQSTVSFYQRRWTFC